MPASHPGALPFGGSTIDDAVAPAADLVAEDAQAAGPSGSDGAFGDDPAFPWTLVGDRGHLDGIAVARVLDRQGGVVDVASGATLDGGSDGFVDSSVEAHGVAARAERDP
jgi:hypothetical protein